MRKDWWFGAVRDESFQYPLNDREAKALFAECVRVASIECSAFCNRRCRWCSNASYPRSKQKLLSPQLYESILNQLASIGWSGKMVYSSGYSEPLAEPGFIARVRKAREALPRAMLHTHTNGDYLTRELINELAAAGLTNLYVMAYDSRAQVDGWAKKLRISLPATRDEPDWYELEGRQGRMNVRVTWRNFAANGTNRGGLVPDLGSPEERQVPCFEPSWHFVIEHTGKVVPCCQIRTDADEHADCWTADLVVNSDIFRAYASRRAVSWRRSAIGFGGHQGPCRLCDWKATDRFQPI